MSLFILSLLVAVLALPPSGHAATVSLVWNWDAPSVPPMGYIVERKVGFAGEYVEVGSTTETTWTDTDVPVRPAKPVYWQVRAVHELGTTDPSNEISLSLSDVPQNIRLVVETSGPSATVSRVSVRTKVRKRGPVALVSQGPGRTKGRK